VLETATELLVHGFGDDLDEAMRAASLRTLALLGSRYGVSRDDAYAFMSLAVDFTVTQVVDTRPRGARPHRQALLPALAVIASWTFTPADGVPPSVAPFAPATAAGEHLHLTGQMPTGLDGRLVSEDIAEARPTR